jgi:hypothetical protein
MPGIKIGEGRLIGEYTSIRDANHYREPDQPIRDCAYGAKTITIGHEVWLERGVTVLGRVMIGDKATVGSRCSRDPRCPCGRDSSRHPCRTPSPKDPLISPDLFLQTVLSPSSKRVGNREYPTQSLGRPAR